MDRLGDDLPERLTREVGHGRGIPAARERLAPQLAYGRHAGPAAFDARTASVVILLYPRQQQWWVPLTVRQPHLTDHAGQISLPGGMLEPDERSDVGALRELAEELGVAESLPRLIGHLTPLYVFNSNFLVTPWIACLADPPSFAPQLDEVAEVFEMSLTALLDESHIGQIQIQRGAFRYSAPCIRCRQYRIWGATSMILAEFCAVLRRSLHPISPGSLAETDL